MKYEYCAALVGTRGNEGVSAPFRLIGNLLVFISA